MPLSAHGATNREFSTNGEQKVEMSICLTDKTLVALLNLYGSRLSRWLVVLFPKVKDQEEVYPISQHALKSWVRLKTHTYR